MESSSVVIDIGSSWCKVGLAEKNNPTLAIPTVVGYYLYDEDLKETAPKLKKVIGLENMHVLKELFLKGFPVYRGKILNWEAMEDIWRYTFDSLRVNTKNHSVLVTGLPWEERNNQKKVLEIMMETFDVPSLYFGNQAELALFGSGLLTGMVLDCGAGLTRIAPIFGGNVISDCMQVHEVGGLDISALLYKYLFYEDMSLDNFFQREAMEGLKEKLCYVSKIHDEKTLSNDLISRGRVSALPDGKIVSLTEKHCTVPDFLFDPSQYGVPGVQLSLEVLKAAMTCPNKDKAHIFSRVVLSGGSTLFPGFPERLVWELNNMKPLMYPTKVVSKPNRIYLPWVGGAILTRLSTSRSRFVTRSEYNEAIEKVLT